jgi:hypothetical protein
MSHLLKRLVLHGDLLKLRIVMLPLVPPISRVHAIGTHDRPQTLRLNLELGREIAHSHSLTLLEIDQELLVAVAGVNMNKVAQLSATLS